MIFLLTALLSAAHSQQLLLVGNSYVFYNNLDLIVADLMTTTTSPVQSARLTGGGMTFSQHVELSQQEGSEWHTAWNDPSLSWDWVILQEQSQIPGFPEDDPNVVASMEAALQLNALVEQNNAETVFLMTWGRRDGDSRNPSRYGDFSTMQALLAEGYLRYRDASSTPDRSTWVAPVGLAFAHIHDSQKAAGEDPLDPKGLFWSLYGSDGSHPSPSGSYLAGCVVFVTLTGESCVGRPALDGMTDERAGLLQQAADAAVFGSVDWLDYPWETDTTPADTAEEQDTTGDEKVDTDQREDTAGQPGAPAPSTAAGCGGCSHGPAANMGLGAGLWLLGMLRRQRS